MTANKKLVEILTTVGGSDVAFFQDLRDISVTFKQHDMWKE